jgi:hypothetical protein
MDRSKKSERTLALYVSRRGIAFVLFTSPLAPHDWGTKEARGTDKHADCMRLTKELIKRFTPDVLVIEEVHEQASRRFPRIRRLYTAIAVYAKRQGIEVQAYSRTAVSEAFSELHATTKYEIATAIVGVIPALAAWLPRKRKPWETEVPAQGIFDAASLGLAFFASAGQLDLAQTTGKRAVPPLGT